MFFHNLGRPNTLHKKTKKSAGFFYNMSVSICFRKEPVKNEDIASVVKSWETARWCEKRRIPIGQGPGRQLLLADNSRDTQGRGEARHCRTAYYLYRLLALNASSGHPAASEAATTPRHEFRGNWTIHLATTRCKTCCLGWLPVTGAFEQLSLSGEDRRVTPATQAALIYNGKV